MMRIVILSLGYHPDLTGGAYRYVTEMAERLALRGHHLEVVVPNPGNRLDPRERRNGVSLNRVPDGEGPFFNNWRTENRAARRVLSGLLGVSGTLVVLAHAYLAPAVRRFSDPLVFLFTGPWAEEYRLACSGRQRAGWRRWLDRAVRMQMVRVERRALRSVRRVLTISRYYQQMLPVWHGPDIAPISVISAGVDQRRFAPPADRAGTRCRLGLRPDEFLFLSVRRLEPRMGLVTLVEGFSRVAGRHPNAKLWIAGTGSLKDSLARQIDSMGLNRQVELTGYISEEDLPAYYGAADCSVMPSVDLEGFGLATAESLACGTPVLGSRAGATPELIADLGRHLLFESGAEPLADRLMTILSDPSSLPARETCRRHAETRFSWDVPVSALERHGEALMKGRESR